MMEQISVQSYRRTSFFIKHTNFEQALPFLYIFALISSIDKYLWKINVMTMKVLHLQLFI